MSSTSTTKRMRDEDFPMATDVHHSSSFLNEHSSRTFLDRHGVTQPTHSWPTSENVIVLQTSARWRPTTNVPSVFFASRFILAKESTVFQEMFDRANISSSRKPRVESSDSTSRDADSERKEVVLYEGHTMILVEDDPTDLQDFLEALHDYRSYLHSSKWGDIHSIAALIRLSHRYKVEPLHRQILSTLAEGRYPLTLDTYHTFDKASDHRLSTLVALNVVHEVGYNPLIPILTYLCATSWSLSELVDAHLRSNAPADASCWFIDERARTLTIRLRCSFPSWFLGGLHSSMRKRPSGCDDRAKCKAGYATWSEQLLGAFNDDSNAVDVFRDSKFGVKKRLFCEVCREKAILQAKALQAEAWESLPTFVGMMPWEELLKEAGIEQEKEADFEVDELHSDS